MSDIKPIDLTLSASEQAYMVHADMEHIKQQLYFEVRIPINKEIKNELRETIWERMVRTAKTVLRLPGIQKNNTEFKGPE
jgi:hypothetical protein